jgi:hypothetical protein
MWKPSSTAWVSGSVQAAVETGLVFGGTELDGPLGDVPDAVAAVVGLVVGAALCVAPPPHAVNSRAAAAAGHPSLRPAMAMSNPLRRQRIDLVASPQTLASKLLPESQKNT